MTPHIYQRALSLLLDSRVFIQNDYAPLSLRSPGLWGWSTACRELLGETCRARNSQTTDARGQLESPFAFCPNYLLISRKTLLRAQHKSNFVPPCFSLMSVRFLDKSKGLAD